MSDDLRSEALYPCCPYIGKEVLHVADILRQAVNELVRPDDGKVAVSEFDGDAIGRSSSYHGPKWIYNPLDYAWESYRHYILRFGANPKRVVLLGMNPGPWGMAQTGIPFGEVDTVINWLGITDPVGRPVPEHPKRPVEGYACRRSEVSGRRLWGLVRDRFREPDAFFADHIVLNYCPLVFMEESGRNITPDKLPKELRTRLDCLCDDHLEAVIRLYRPRFLIGVGGFAAGRLGAVLKRTASGISRDNLQGPTVVTMLHPSPASPAANRGWAEQASAQMEAAGVWE